MTTEREIWPRCDDCGLVLDDCACAVEPDMVAAEEDGLFAAGLVVEAAEAYGDRWRRGFRDQVVREVAASNCQPLAVRVALDLALSGRPDEAEKFDTMLRALWVADCAQRRGSDGEEEG